MARVDIDHAKKTALAHRLGRAHVRRTANLILQGARQLAPRGSHTSGSGARRPGLQLQQSLKTKSNNTATTASTLIGSDKQYAATVHQGSSPHRINGRGKQLKFEWERGSLLMAARSRGRLRGRGGSRRLRSRGNYFFFKMVTHPGNKRPVRYLTTPLHLYGRMGGFVTSSARVNRTRLP